MKRSIRAAALAVAAAFAVALSGCSTSSMAASRSVLYDSVESLSADSSAVAIVEVRAVKDLKGETPMSVAETIVSESFDVPDLGRDVGAVTHFKAGAVLNVLQLGTRDMTETPAPLLEQGGTYLLFLTPSMLDGDEASAFYVTGGTAGLYESAGQAAFRQVSTDDSDALPSFVTVAAGRLVFDATGRG